MKTATFLFASTGLGWIVSSPVFAGDPARTSRVPTNVDKFSKVESTLVALPRDPPTTIDLTPQAKRIRGENEDSKYKIVWEPIHVRRYQPQETREKWESICRQALEKEECSRAKIYAGGARLQVVSNVKRKFLKASLWKDGDHSPQGKIVRLYSDGAIEWNPNDEHFPLHGPKYKWRENLKNLKLADKGPVHVPDLLTQSKRFAPPTTELAPQAKRMHGEKRANEDSKHKIVWEPIRAPKHHPPQWKGKWESICRQALEKEECSRAKIYGGTHLQISLKIQRKFLKASLWKDGDHSPKGKIVRLYSDGEIKWNPNDEHLPLHGPKYKWRQNQKNLKLAHQGLADVLDLRTQEMRLAPPLEADINTQAVHTGQAQAPGGGGVRHDPNVHSIENGESFRIHSGNGSQSSGDRSGGNPGQSPEDGVESTAETQGRAGYYQTADGDRVPFRDFFSSIGP